MNINAILVNNAFWKIHVPRRSESFHSKKG